MKKRFRGRGEEGGGWFISIEPFQKRELPSYGEEEGFPLAYLCTANLSPSLQLGNSEKREQTAWYPILEEERPILPAWTWCEVTRLSLHWLLQGEGYTDTMKYTIVSQRSRQDPLPAQLQEKEDNGGLIGANGFILWLMCFNDCFL